MVADDSGGRPTPKNLIDPPGCSAQKSLPMADGQLIFVIRADRMGGVKIRTSAASAQIAQVANQSLPVVSAEDYVVRDFRKIVDGMAVGIVHVEVQIVRKFLSQRHDQRMVGRRGKVSDTGD